MFSVQLLRYCG